MTLELAWATLKELDNKKVIILRERKKEEISWSDS